MEKLGATGEKIKGQMKKEKVRLDDADKIGMGHTGDISILKCLLERQFRNSINLNR